MVEVRNYGKFLQTDEWGEEVFILVGQIAIAHAQLCHQLFLAPKRIKQITLEEWGEEGEKDFVPKKIKLIKRELAARLGEVPPELSELLEEIVTANSERNAVIHAYWGCTKKEGKIIAWHRIWENTDLGVNKDDLRALRDKLRRLRHGLSLHTRILENPENPSKPSASYPSIETNEGQE